MSTDSSSDTASFYKYEPSHILPAVFGALVGVSLGLHIYQTIHYRFWRVTFFVMWAGAVFTAGWFTRLASSYDHELAPIGSTSASLYISQTVLVLGGPPIFAAVQYSIASRLLHYIPYCAPLHPHRVYVFFVYLGALVESLTGAGGAMQASNPDDITARIRGETLISIALVLQAALSLFFVTVVYVAQSRASRIFSSRTPKNIRNVCTTLYGTSALLIFRCIFRAIEAFSGIPKDDPTYECTGLCKFTSTNEWYVYAFEAAPMVLFSFWLNVMHPGRFLPRERLRYLDLDRKTERIGAGWIDRRSQWQTFADPFDLSGQIKGKPSHEKFWERPEMWSEVEDGRSFATGTGTNVKGKGRLPREGKSSDVEYMPLRESVRY